MLINDSFIVFAQGNGARPFNQTKIAGFTDSAFSSVFGLGGILVLDTSELHVTIGQRTDAGSLDFKTITSGVLGIYRIVPDSDIDYLVQEVQLQPEMLKKPRGSQWSWEIVIKTELPPDELMLGCTLTTPVESYSTWTPVESEARTKQVNYYLERFRTSQDVPVFEQPTTRVYTESKDASDDFYTLDFAKQDNPVIIGAGTLMYQGGGNRYLINADGESELQDVNQAPWTMPGHLFIEGSAWNYLTDSRLVLNKHRVNTSASMITTKQTNPWSEYLGYNALSFAVSGPSALDSSWEFETEQVQVVNTTLTGSLFGTCTNQSNRKFPVAIGLRFRNTLNGPVVREAVEQLGTEQIRDLSLLSVTDHVITPTSTQYFVSVFFQVRQLSPGDRFVCDIAAPQLENTGTASSRIPSVTQRLADQVTFTPSDPLYDTLYGKFRTIIFPAYSGFPGTLGDQYLFDTRDSHGEAGFYAKHRVDGVIEFVLVGDTISDIWSCVSSTTVAFTYGESTALEFWFDTNQMTLKLNNNVIGTQTFIVDVTVPDQNIVRIGRDYTSTYYMNGEVMGFSLASDPTVID